MRFVAVVLVSACGLAAQGQDFAEDLLQAALRGRNDQVKTFLDGGANLEASDRNGRTPLMLAAQHGQAATVALLVERGAKVSARDRDGATAYVLALFSPLGRGDHEAVLKLLPAPPRPRMALEVGWSAGRLASSCFATREEVARTVEGLQLPAQFLRAFGAYVQFSGRDLVQLVGRPADADALLRIELQPTSACVAEAGDIVGLAIDVRVLREPGMEPVFQKPFGAGSQGLHAQRATNLRQYASILQPWIKPQAGPIYWAAAAALYRAAR
jgi:hypothetical protein